MVCYRVLQNLYSAWKKIFICLSIHSCNIFLGNMVKFLLCVQSSRWALVLLPKTSKTLFWPVNFSVFISPPGQRPCKLLPSLVVRRKLSHLNLLLWNPWTKLSQTWQGWVPFKIVSDKPALQSRWLLLLKIEISSIVHCCFIINLNELKFLLQLHGNE